MSGLSSSPNIPSTISEITYDDVGRCFCREHGREVCHECCMSFDVTNRMVEEDAGLVKKRSPLEVAAEDYAMVLSALQGMERMYPRPSREVFEENRNYLRNAEEKLQQFKRDGETGVNAAVRAAVEKQQRQDIENRAMMQAWSKTNPGKTNWEFGGPETQKIYDQIAAPPPCKADRADKFTCAYCNKHSTTKLKCCARCKRMYYCSSECQKAAWKAHRKECVPAEKEPKALPLTWEQVKAHGGAPVTGRVLQVRAVLDESVTRQVFSCKDHAGVLKRIAAYTDSRSIPGLKQGSVVKWKNPRFHYFMDGSSGARIEEKDLVDITVTNE